MNRKMNNVIINKIFKNAAVVLAAAVLLCVLAGCYTPNPLYGTWADNDGNKIQFIDDGTFSAIIKDSDDNLISYSGDWAAIDNVLIFSIKGEDNAYTRNTEWDLRGAMLYLTWTSNNSTKMLTLYHTAR